MRVGREARVGLDAVLVEDAEGAEVCEAWIIPWVFCVSIVLNIERVCWKEIRVRTICEAECVVGVEPAVVAVASCA